MYETVTKILLLRYEKVLVAPVWVKQTSSYQRLDNAIHFYYLPNPYAVSAKKIKSDLIHCNDLVEEVNYLKTLNISSLSQLKGRLTELSRQKKTISGERFNLEKIYQSLSSEQKKQLEEYQLLLSDYESLYEKQDDAWEETEDKLQILRKKLPEALTGAQEKITDLKAQDQTLWKEQKIIERILEQEGL